MRPRATIRTPPSAGPATEVVELYTDSSAFAATSSLGSTSRGTTVLMLATPTENSAIAIVTST